MLGYSQVFIAVTDSLKTEQEPSRSYPHILSYVFGAPAEIARSECPLTRSNNRLVKIVEVPPGQPGACLLCDGGPIRTYSGDIDLSAELSNLGVGHAGPDISSRYSEPRLPTAAVQDLWHTTHARIDDEVLNAGDVPQIPDN